MTSLRSDLIVGGLLRAAEADGGNGAVVARGDATTGAILVILTHRGRSCAMMERVSSLTNGFTWNRRDLAASLDEQKVAQLVDGRKRFDGDLWVVELDIPDVERFIEDSLGET